MKQKRLSKSQKETLRILAEMGVRPVFLAKVTAAAEGVALSTAYPYISPNRISYTHRVKQERVRLQESLKPVIRHRVECGETTRDISEDWGVPLKIVNRILVR